MATVRPGIVTGGRDGTRSTLAVDCRSRPPAARDPPASWPALAERADLPIRGHHMSDRPVLPRAPAILSASPFSSTEATPTAEAKVSTAATSRELTELGHTVTMFAGQPWPVADAPVALEKVGGLDLYSRENPFRVPWPHEFRTLRRRRRVRHHVQRRVPEPYAFSQRAYKALRHRRRRVRPRPRQSVSRPRTARLPPRRLAVRQHVAPPDHRRSRSRLSPPRRGPWRRSTLRRWYGFLADADERRAPGAAPHHGVGELEEGHRRTDGRRHRHAARRAGRRRPGTVPPASSRRTACPAGC